MEVKRCQFFFGRFFRSLLVFGILHGCSCSSPDRTGWDRLPEILAQIKPPSFPEQKIFIADFGAVGDGRTDCSDAFRLAIQACHAAGGGRVVVAPGVYLTGPLHLLSRVNLHVEKGATIRFSRDLQDYLPPVFTRFEGVECLNYSPMIYAFEQQDVAITGEGVLDGQADSTNWWPWAGKARDGWKTGMPHQRADRNALFLMADSGVPPAQRIFGTGHFLRVNFIQFYRCKNVLIEGVTVQRSPMWAIHPVLSENVTIRAIHYRSHGPNNDGCNPESSRNVLIRDCYFDAGDDCIAIKSGRNGDGRRVNVPSENIVIQNCTMHSGHGGVVIGSEISGSCRHVYAENCQMDSPELERALRIKTNSQRGGVIENIHLRNITVGEVSDAVIRINFHYEEGDSGDHTPIVRNVRVSNLESKKSEFALVLQGYARSPISGIYLEECQFNGVNNGNIMSHVQDLVFNNVTINGEPQQAIDVEDEISTVESD